ncbi:MAG: response regulator [Vicinamibacterales bacterium]
MKLPYRILVLDDDQHALSGMVELLRNAGHLVTAAATFDSAKSLLAISTYELLITDIRLRGFNGIDLVRQCHSDFADMAIMIITGYDDELMEVEASRYGACFAGKPIKPVEFMSTVDTCLAGVRRERRWSRKRVTGPFRVTAHGRPATVVDVSYGGLCLEIASLADLPQLFDVRLPGIGLTLAVDVVWRRVSDEKSSVVCGGTLAADSIASARTWQEIVDRLTV